MNLGKPKPGEKVVLTSLPPGFLDDLPVENQEAIRQMLGKPVRLNEYDVEGRAELEFTDSTGQIHFVYVSPSVIKVAE
jgi:hypothetical protein